MVVTMTKMSSKAVVMDVMVEGIPPKFGIFLSRTWTSKLKGSLQMNMSYVPIPGIGGNKRMYSENRSPYVVSIQESPNTHAIYDIDIDLGCSVLFNDGVPCDLEKTIPIEAKEEEKQESTNKHEFLERK